MARLADAIAANAPKKGPHCTVGAAIDGRKLTKADLADLNAVLADDSTPATAIARGLAVIGVANVKPEALRRHRKGDCGCPR